MQGLRYPPCYTPATLRQCWVPKSTVVVWCNFTNTLHHTSYQDLLHSSQHNIITACSVRRKITSQLDGNGGRSPCSDTTSRSITIHSLNWINYDSAITFNSSYVATVEMRLLNKTRNNHLTHTCVYLWKQARVGVYAKTAIYTLPQHVSIIQCCETSRLQCCQMYLQ